MMFCNIINVFTVTFDQLNVSLLNESINFSKAKCTDPKPLNGVMLKTIKNTINA